MVYSAYNLSHFEYISLHPVQYLTSCNGIKLTADANSFLIHQYIQYIQYTIQLGYENENLKSKLPILFTHSYSFRRIENLRPVGLYANQQLERRQQHLQLYLSRMVRIRACTSCSVRGCQCTSESARKR